MESLNSFKGYGKVDPIEEQSFSRKTRRRIITVAVSSALLLAIVIGAVAGTVVHNRKNATSAAAAADPSPAAALKALCGVTLYPDSCTSSIGSFDNSSTTDPEQLFRLSLQVALNELNSVASFPETLISKLDDQSVKSALAVCQDMMEDSIDHLHDSISSMDVGSQENKTSTARIEDLRTWLSTSLTDHETCLDALREVNSTVSESVLEEVTGFMKNSTKFVSNSLAIATKVLGVMSSYKFTTHRKLLEESNSAFPSWVRAADRRLLQKKSKSVVPDVMVAQDGSGDFKTINEALEMVPEKSKTRFVIYIKAGEYREFVHMNKTLQNVMMYGDGMYKTIITFDRNTGHDRIPTFSTATLAVTGNNFIAIDIGFKNTAGAIKEQAVALRSGSDLSVFYRCSFDAFQDTLYPHSNRQFYRECDITGTIDFIFGNAAVVFQKCNILPRQPLPKQLVTITAQGKKDPNQNTGISIHASTISNLDELSAPTYLGRPWKDYSTTIIMQTNIGSFIEPTGWVEWTENVEPPNTIFYGEYENNGPGASLSNRVTWAGYRPSISSNQASKFSVLDFIDGPAWIPQTGVTFDSSLN